VVAKTFNYLVAHPVPALKISSALTTPTGGAKSGAPGTTTTLKKSS